MSEVDKSRWVWLQNPETGGVAQFPPASAGLWRARGWVDADPPSEPNPLKDVVAEAPDAPVDEPVVAPTQAETPTATTPAAAGAKPKESSRG